MFRKYAPVFAAISLLWGLNCWAMDSASAEVQSLVHAFDADPQKWEYISGSSTKGVDYAQKLLNIAKAQPGSPAAEDALIWLFTYAPEQFDLTEACQLIESFCMNSQQLRRICVRLCAEPHTEAKENLLSTLAERSPYEDVRGNALFYLADLKVQRDPSKARALYKQIADSYGSVRLALAFPVAFETNTLREEAQNKLYRIEHLAVGRRAPWTIGHDIDGKKVALAHYRGKVVMLDFFADW
jgi:hypothetical protein